MTNSLKLQGWHITIYIALTAIFYFVQNFIIESLKDSYTFYYSVLNIYIFHFIITLVILAVIYLVSKKAPNYIGFTFLGFILFKMVAAVIFLIPLIKMEGVSKIPDFISFFIPYFLFLSYEIYVTLKLLKQSEA